MKQQVEVAMREAENYAKNLLSNSWKGISHANKDTHLEELEQRKIQLMVYYLFPQLSKWQKNLLICLYWEHAMFEKLVNADLQSSSLQYRISYERSIVAIEQNYTEFVNRTKANVPVEKMSPLQQAVMNEKFFNITFKIRA
jgi:hypothetical protein